MQSWYIIKNGSKETKLIINGWSVVAKKKRPSCVSDDKTVIKFGFSFGLYTISIYKKKKKRIILIIFIKAILNYTFHLQEKSLDNAFLYNLSVSTTKISDIHRIRRLADYAKWSRFCGCSTCPIKQSTNYQLSMNEFRFAIAIQKIIDS